MKQVDVRFGSGRDVLNAYWGYLSTGGLVIREPEGLDVGQPVALNVQIESSQSRYSFCGKVVRRQSDGRIVVAFRPGEPHDMLLTEALAETDKVPARRHRRYRVDLVARVSAPTGEELPARVVNLSEGGCCVRVDQRTEGELDLGTNIDIKSPDFSVTGEVVWTRHHERGVRFANASAIKDFLDSL